MIDTSQGSHSSVAGTKLGKADGHDRTIQDLLARRLQRSAACGLVGAFTFRHGGNITKGESSRLAKGWGLKARAQVVV